MCDPSHIQLAAAGTRAFACQFRSTRIERETEANVFKDVCVQGLGAYGKHCGSSCHRAWGFEGGLGPDQVSSGSGSCLKTGIALSQHITPAVANASAQQGEPRWSASGQGNFRTHYWYTRADRAVRQADELAMRLVAVPRQTITVVIMESRNSPEPLGPDELLFFISNQ
jgi:hypothetical protein